MNYSIEICVDNVQSAIDAQEAGANRIELCDNLLEGGTTPGYGTIISAHKNLDLGVNVLIRPRGGDFLYTDIEFDIMCDDIEFCREVGIDGVVTGVLRRDGSVDIERCARLIQLARPMKATFHRAFDMCADPVQGLEDIIEAGFDIILTSGLKNSAEEGAELISELVKKAGSRIKIMAGAGINESNIAMIARVTGASEFHFSVRKVIESEMIFRREGVIMGGSPGYNEYTSKVTDPQKIRNIINILNNL
jgi:copper homeostasis protein